MASPPEPTPPAVSLSAPPPAAAQELALLGRLARRDGKLDRAEGQLLLTYAVGGLGLSRPEAEAILRGSRADPADAPAPRVAAPRRTLQVMLEVALADGALTLNERAFVERVGCELGLPLEEVRAALGAGLAEDRALRDQADLGPEPAPPPRSASAGTPAQAGETTRVVLAAWAALVGLGAVFGGWAAALSFGFAGGVAALVLLLPGRASRARLVRLGRAARGRIRTVTPVQVRRQRGPRGHEQVLIGWDAGYTFRLGELRGAGTHRLPPGRPLERGRAVWVLVDPDDPTSSTLDPRYG